MAKTNYQTIDAYHQAFSGETLARMQTVTGSADQKNRNIPEKGE